MNSLSLKVDNRSVDPILDVVVSLHSRGGMFTDYQEVISSNFAEGVRLRGMHEPWQGDDNPPPLAPIDMEFTRRDGTRWRRELIRGELSEPVLIASDVIAKTTVRLSGLRTAGS